MRHLRRLAHTCAAGAVSGAAVGALQLLVWPDLAVSPLGAVTAFLAWSSWGALWAGLFGFLVVELFGAFMPYLAVQRGFSLGLWRWLAFANWGMVMAVAWYNYERTRQLLVHGRRQGLAGATILAGLFAVVLLVNALGRRARPRPLLWAVVPSTVVVGLLWGYWAASPRPAAAPPVETASGLASQRKVLLVSLEGADLPWLLPAMDRGDMPFLSSRKEEGAWGQVRSVRPHVQAGALATLATGCSPAVHGVVARRTLRLPWLSPQPVALLLSGPWPSRHHLPWRAWERAGVPALQRAPLWEILEFEGLRSGVAGWPGRAAARWHIGPPLAMEAAPFAELEAELQAALEPSLRRRPALAERTRSDFALADQLTDSVLRRLDTHPVDALVVNYDLPARLRPRWTTAEPDPLAHEVLRQALRMLDQELRALWTAFGDEDTVFVVVSPYGMAPLTPWRRLKGLVGTPVPYVVSPSDSPDGFVLFHGPHVKSGVRLRPGRLADVTATMLYLLEIPSSRDMAGRVQLEAIDEEWTARTPLRLVAAYPAGLVTAPGSQP